MDLRQWPAEQQAIVASSLLLSSGIELLAGSCGVDVSGTAGDRGSGTPWPILFSFGMVLAAVGVGVITRVMHMSWFGLVFNVYATGFLRVIGAAEATAFQLAALAISAPCCLLLGLRSSAAPTVHIGPPASESASARQHLERKDETSGAKTKPDERLEADDDAAEWSVEASMCVTMTVCVASLVANVTIWVVLVASLLTTDSLFRVPLGLAVLPLSSWWIKLFSGGAPFVTTNHAKTRAIVQLVMDGAVAANGTKQNRLIGADLGSGDGRLAIALARAGVAEVHGYEINWLLVQYSRARVAKAGLADRVTIHWQSMWDVSLSHCDVVTTYQHTMVMSKLEAKLVKELKPTARVVSNSFRFPNWLAQDQIIDARLLLPVCGNSRGMRVRGYACFSRAPTCVSEASGGQTGDEYMDGGGEEGGAIILYTNPRSNCKLPANGDDTEDLGKKAK